MADLNELKNLEAEEFVINAVMARQENLYKVISFLKEEDFSREAHRLIYHAEVEMVMANQKVDIATLTEKLKQDDVLDKVGGMMALRKIGDSGCIGNVEAHAKIIVDYSRRRRLIAKAREVEDLAADCTNEISKVTSDALSDITGMLETEEEDTKSAKEGVKELATLIDKRFNRQGDCVKTGLIDVDNYITAFESGQLIILAGRPGHGKSAMAGTIAYNMAKAGKRVLMFSMEMERDEVMGRLLSRAVALDGSKLKNPASMTEEDWTKYTVGLSKVGELPIWVNTKSNLTPADVAAVAKRQKGRNGLDLIIVDYLQLMTSGNQREASRVQEIGNITRTFKNLAGTLKVPILLLSQLSRANEKDNRPPKMTDLRDSGAIEQDANTVLLLHREEEKQEDGTKKMTNTAVVNVAKQRGGELGSCRVMFISSQTYFANFFAGSTYEGKIDVPE